MIIVSIQGPISYLISGKSCCGEHLAFCIHIRRPLPSLGPGGAAPGITAGVRLWPARTSACTAHQTPSPLPLPSQVTANTSAVLCQRLASRHTPFRGFQNVREARPITTQNPSVGLCRFATAFPGHREHVALQRQPFASAWPCSI